MMLATAAAAQTPQGVFWRPSAALRVATGPTEKRHLATAVLAAICALTLLLGVAGPASASTAPDSETGVAAQTHPAVTGVGVEQPGSPAVVGGNGVFGYDGVLGCCVAPRTPISLGRFADDTFYDVIPTRAGDLEVLAEVSVSGRTLTLSDIAVYGADGDLVNEVGGPALVGIRNALATEAADAGFDTLRLTGVRVSTSSSANPGHVIDRVIDLERFRR